LTSVGQTYSQAVFTGVTVALLKPVFRKTTFWPCKCLKSLCAIRQNPWATIFSKVEIYHCFNSLQFYFPEDGLKNRHFQKSCMIKTKIK